MKALAGALALLLAAAAGPAIAAGPPKEVFVRCDGYGAPAGSGDGMTSWAIRWGLFNIPGDGTTNRQNLTPSAKGVSQCDAALTHPGLKPKFWMRKVSLLRARAMHRLAASDNAGALADLDLAEAAAVDPTDPYYRRSLGIGIDFVRAYALRKSGKPAEAEALAMAAWAQRPYNRQTAVAALYVMGPGADLANQETVTRVLAQLQPSDIGTMQDVLIRQGRFLEALQVRPLLVAPRRLSEGEGAPKEDVNAATALLFFTWHDCEAAYALAATGREAKAREVLATAKARVEADAGAHPKEGREASDYVEVWSKLVDWRIMAGNGKTQDALKSLGAAGVPPSPVTSELLNLLLSQVPPQYTAATDNIKKVRDGLEAEWNAGPEEGLEVLFRNLPEAETRERFARYKNGDISVLEALLGGTVEGYAATPAGGGATTLVTFRGMASSGTIVEEMALLRAADLARKAGQSGVIVVSRKDFIHFVRTMSYGTVIRTDPDGFHTDLEVAYAAPPVIPEAYRAAPWRVIDANKIYSELAPIYGATAGPAGRANPAR